MSHHFANSNHKEKRTYDNFKSAWLECNKYNSKIENLGKKSRNPYHCKICDKIHVGTSTKTLSFKIQERALKAIEESISNFILVGKINL